MPPNRNWSRRIEACFKKVFVDVYEEAFEERSEDFYQFLQGQCERFLENVFRGGLQIGIRQVGGGGVRKGLRKGFRRGS